MSFYPVAGPLSTNARDPGTTIRNPSTALLGIDSEDRFVDYVAERSSTNSSPYDFTITKPENIMAGFFTRVGVTEVAFPWVIPNINLKSNKIYLNYQVNGAGPILNVLITLPIGYYTPDFLAQALAANIAAQSPIEVSVQYGGRTQTPGVNLTGKDLSFYIEPTGPSVNDLIGFSPLPYNSAVYPWPSSTKQLFDVLGFTSANTGGVYADVTGQITFCQWTRYVDITCQQLTLNQSLKDAASQPTVHDMLARLYVSAAPGQSSTTHTDLSGVPAGGDVLCFPGNAPTTIYKDYSHPKQIQWLPNQNVPGYLRFVVYDDSGAPLQEALGTTSPPSVNWSLTAQFSEN